MQHRWVIDNKFLFSNEEINELLIIARMWMYQELATHPVEKYFAWICLPIFLVMFSAGFVYLLAPQAIGNALKFYVFAAILLSYFQNIQDQGSQK